MGSVVELDVWLHVAMTVLTAASVARYVIGHGLTGRGPVILLGATALLAIYFATATGADQHSPVAAYAWSGALIGCWLALVVLAPSFAWVAVPLAFVALRLLPFVWAAAAITTMLITVVVAWSMMQGKVDPTLIAGPLAVAALAITAYRALEQESSTRRDLLLELRDAQDDLAEAQRDAGALAERARLSREIHDSIAQALSSINLLLQAADQRWTTDHTAARDYIRQASLTARNGLTEVRSIVHDLAAADLASDPTGAALAAALSHECEQIESNTDIRTDLQIHGRPTPLAAETATALLRSARGALANVAEHSSASKATVSLTYQPDSVLLDIRDNGCGFERNGVISANGRGRGLAGIESRAKLFGGIVTVESAPGDGTAIAVSIPLHQQ